MRSIPVHAASGSYEVVLGRDILELVGEKTRACAGGTRAFLVSDDNVYPLYGEQVSRSLADAGYEVFSMVVPAGERTKNMRQLTELLERMAQNGLGRDDVVVALGGGVIGDLAGFAAAVYMRGCKVVQVPTSLLAMVDSSVGGKTAVDLAAGKNLAGAFLQPRVVVASLSCLTTIEPALITDSCGEVIKYGVMTDPRLFEELGRAPLTAADPDLERLEAIVARCVEIKRDVVDADEREGGIRQTLNLGHTIGHAIERAGDYRLGHGSCVAAGMCIMARACAATGRCSRQTAERIEELAGAYGLPTSTEVDAQTLFTYACSDKKRHANAINIVSIRDIGRVEVEQVALAELKGLIELGVQAGPSSKER